MITVSGQTVETSGSIDGVYSIVFTVVSVTLNGVTYSYTNTPPVVRRKVTAVY